MTTTGISDATRVLQAGWVVGRQRGCTYTIPATRWLRSNER